MAKGNTNGNNKKGKGAKSSAAHAANERRQVAIEEFGLPAQKARKGRAPRSKARDAGEVIDANAIAFINARHDPWNAGEGVVFPDADPFPCATQHLKGRFVPAVQPFVVSTGKYWAFQVAPDLKNFVKQPLGPFANAPGDIVTNGAWAPTLEYTELLAAFAFYRTVALGIRIVGSATALDSGGSIVISRVPPYNGDGSPAFDLDDLFESANTEVLSGAGMQATVSGEKVRWIAISDQASLAIRAGGVMDMMPTASGWRTPDDTSSDANIWVCGYTEDVTGSIGVEVEYDLLINSIPYTSSNQLFDTKAVPSSPDAVAKASLEMDLQQGAQGKRASSGLVSNIGKGAISVAAGGLKKLTSELGPFGQIADKGIDAAASWLGGLFGVHPHQQDRALVLNRNHLSIRANLSRFRKHHPRIRCEMLLRMPRIAVFAGLVELSPLRMELPPAIATMQDFLKHVASTRRRESEWEAEFLPSPMDRATPGKYAPVSEPFLTVGNPALKSG